MTWWRHLQDFTHRNFIDHVIDHCTCEGDCLTHTNTVCYLYTHAVSFVSLMNCILVNSWAGVHKSLLPGCLGIQIFYGGVWYLWAFSIELHVTLVASRVWDNSSIFGNIVDHQSLVNITSTENVKAPSCSNNVLYFVHVHWCDSHVVKWQQESCWLLQLTDIENCWPSLNYS